MGFIKFNKIAKHQRFNYIPRYWDEAKEDLVNRVNLGKGEATDPEISKARIQAGLRRKYYSRAGNNSAVRKSNIRLFAIIGILFFITYLFLKSAAVLRMVEAFTS